MKLVNRTLSAQARIAIIDIIEKDNEFMSKLPSEQELAERLGVSRNTIREALKSLENEGILAARHGVGTFVIRDRKSMKHNLAVLNSTTKIIASHGYTPGTKSVHCDVRTISDSHIVEKLGGKNSMEVFYIERVRTADEIPVVYVEDYIPQIEGIPEQYELHKDEPLFTFLENNGIDISFSNCAVHSVISNPKIQAKLSLPDPKALLLLKQIHYSTKGEPVLYSDSYFLTDKLEFSLIRKQSDLPVSSAP